MFLSLFCVLFMCYSVYRLCVCVLVCVPFMYYSVYCLCVFCILYYCHRVSAHLQFINNNNNNNNNNNFAYLVELHIYYKLQYSMYSTDGKLAPSHSVKYPV